jgi:hypothetical protein
MRTAARSDAFRADAIWFEEAKASQSDGGSLFKLKLYVSVKASLTVIWSAGLNADVCIVDDGVPCLVLEKSHQQ